MNDEFASECKRCGQEPYPEAIRECIKRGTGECELAQRATPPDGWHAEYLRASGRAIQLERERDEARQLRDQLSDELSACTVTMTKAEGVILEMIEQRNALTAAFSEWPRLREWLEMDSFIRGYMSAELPAFDAMSNALSAVKGGQS